MSRITQKAKIAKVKIGNIEIEGMMLPNGCFGISVPQIAELFGANKNYASQELKRLCGKGFRPHKIATELGNQKINWISLEDFEFVMMKLDRSGNQKAQQFRDELIGLSLQQLWSDAFNIKFEKEERQLWLKERQIHRPSYHPKVTSWLKKDGCIDGWEYGQKFNSVKKKAGLPLISIDNYTYDQLITLNDAESQYDMARRIGLTHNDAVELIRIV